MHPVGRRDDGGGAGWELLAVSGTARPAESGRLHAQAADASITRAPAFSAKQLLEPPADGWLTNGGTLFNQRYSPLDAINRETVGNLRGVWRSRLNGSGAGSKYSGEAQPIVHDGVIYVVTGADDVFALSVASGAILWSYEANLDPDISTVCCGWTSRGVALGDGRVYVGQLDGRLVALDQQTGEPVWSVQAERWEDGYTITSAPLYVDGLIVTGFAGAERGIRGRVKAYDATESAATIASAFTGTDIDEEIPADGESYLGGTFGGVSIPSTGILAALDMTTNRLVWRQRLGDLCYSGSIVTAGGLLFVSRNDGRFTALDSSDGSRLWEFQTGAGVNATASMFEYAGTEYVVVYSGGSLFARAPRGDGVGDSDA